MTMFDKGDARAEMAKEAEVLATEVTITPDSADGRPATGSDGVGVDQVADGDRPAAADGEEGSAELSDIDTAPSGGRHVPFSALKAERQKRQQIERDLHTLQGQVKAWQNAMLAQIQGGRSDAAAGSPPSVEDDPLGALRYTQQQLAELQGAVASQVRAQQLQGAYVAGASAFSRAHPDFAEAYNHMIQSRADELRVLGAPEPAIAQQLRLEEQQMVAAAVGAGRNPAEIAYAAAKARGWRPRAGGSGPAKPGPDGAAMLPPTGRAGAAVALAPGGRPNRDNVSAEEVARLSGRDFDAGWEKLFGRRAGNSPMFTGR